MEKILEVIFAPVIAFLKEQGLWEGISAAYEQLVRVVEKVFNTFGIEGGESSFPNLLMDFLRLVVDILITVVRVLIDIVNWVLNLF
jgi:hypothetical protein